MVRALPFPLTRSDLYPRSDESRDSNDSQSQSQSQEKTKEHHKNKEQTQRTKKAGFMAKMKGEAKVLIGKLEGKPEKVEQGQRMKSGEPQAGAA